MNETIKSSEKRIQAIDIAKGILIVCVVIGHGSENDRIKIYCYIAVCGLLWSNWCEYKSHLGVEFGEYSLRQYRYAKDYYKIVQEEMKKLEGRKNA